MYASSGCSVWWCRSQLRPSISCLMQDYASCTPGGSHSLMPSRPMQVRPRAGSCVVCRSRGHFCSTYFSGDGCERRGSSGSGKEWSRALRLLFTLMAVLKPCCRVDSLFTYIRWTPLTCSAAAKSTKQWTHAADIADDASYSRLTTFQLVQLAPSYSFRSCRLHA